MEVSLQAFMSYAGDASHQDQPVEKAGFEPAVLVNRHQIYSLGPSPLGSLLQEEGFTHPL